MFLLDIDDQIVSQVEWRGGYSPQDLETRGMEGSAFRVCSAAHGCTVSWVPAPRISGNRKKEPGCKAHHPGYSHVSSILRTPHPD